MSPPLRSKAMAAALAVTLAGSAWFALQPEPPIAEGLPVARAGAPRSVAPVGAARGPAATAAPPAWPVAALRDPAAMPWPPLGNAARAAWSAPAAPVQAAAAPLPAGEAPPPPPPPRFPFTFVGRWENLADPLAEAGSAPAARRALVLLAGPQRSYAVGAGDLVGDQWRIERVAASSFTVTYLPLGKVQTVSFKPS